MLPDVIARCWIASRSWPLHGEIWQDGYEIMLGDCLWHVYGMIGKLSCRVYILSSA